MYKKIFRHLNTNIEKYLVGLAILISIISFLYFYSHNQLNLSFGDAVSRLNISRKLTDNLTPGIGQLGGVWLPLPQLIMSLFVWNNFAWHSGIGGYILSGSSFVVLILFLYKLGVLAFNSRFSGLIMSLTAFININLLYFQTTAMTEVFFLLSVVLSTYYLLKWAKTFKIFYLMIAALCVSISTLIRYEGYFLLFASIIIVILIIVVKFKDKRIVEGQTILYSTLAVTGVVLWCIYCAAIFHDPLYWKAVYSGEKAVISTEENQIVNNASTKQALPKVIDKYASAALQTNGIIVSSISLIGTGIYLIYIIKTKKGWKDPKTLILLLPLSTSLFVIFSIYNGLPLELPSLSTQSLMNKSTSYNHEYNIRYGLNYLPMVAIFLGYIASKKLGLKIFISSVLLLQLISTFYGTFYTIYQFPLRLSVQPESTSIEKPNDWMKRNYTNGLILISAYKHDPDMFAIGLNYNRYIHEGAGNYWSETIKSPKKYATWIYMYHIDQHPELSDDPVTKHIWGTMELKDNFNKVYDNGVIAIFEIKTHPDIVINN